MALHIVLLGGGLCNSVAIKVIHDFFTIDQPDIRLTLISPWDYTYYSAMFPGVLSDQYQEEETRIELRPLAYACNADFILGKALKILPQDRVVEMEGGERIAYDILAINIGSRTLGTVTVPGVEKWAILTRPMNIFIEKLQVEEQKCAMKTSPIRLLVVGSGVSGIELICSLKYRLERRFTRQVVAILVDKNPVVTKSARASYQALVNQNLHRYKIEILPSALVKQVCGPGDIELEDGRHVTGDILVWATGPEPQAVETGLDCCPRGFIKVSQSLQCMDFPNVFAGGDCITMQGMPYGFPPKTGVHAVQEGPILALNIIAYARSQLFEVPLSLMIYEPATDLLQLVNFGDGRGLANKYGMTFSGKWAFELKNYQDRRLIKRFCPKTLLGEDGYQRYLELRGDGNMREKVYQYRKSTIDEEWMKFVYEMEVLGGSTDEDIRELSPPMAFSILWEASDVVKQSSSTEFLYQLQIIKRTDVDFSFRSEMQNSYKLAISQIRPATE